MIAPLHTNLDYNTCRAKPHIWKQATLNLRGERSDLGYSIRHLERFGVERIPEGQLDGGATFFATRRNRGLLQTPESLASERKPEASRIHLDSVALIEYKT